MDFAIDQQQFLQGYLPIRSATMWAETRNLPTGNGSGLIMTGPGFVTKDDAEAVISPRRRTVSADRHRTGRAGALGGPDRVGAWPRGFVREGGMRMATTAGGRSRPVSDRSGDFRSTKRFCSRTGVGAVIIAIFVLIVFAVIAGQNRLLDLAGTLSYLDVAAQVGSSPPPWPC